MPHYNNTSNSPVKTSKGSGSGLYIQPSPRKITTRLHR